MQRNPVLDELAWRGLLHQHTEGLADLLGRGPVSAYAGFDPTARSLHVGNLIPVMGLTHLQRYGHRPIVLVGGGTGLIGDPSGRATERQLNTHETVEENLRAIQSQLEHFLDFSGSNAARVMNNADWLVPLRAIDFMRDVGKHFTVNYMMAKESVRSRLEGGISYTEFSYMLLQAYDYLELYRREGVRLQIGGSDQWGNITAGTELIRRAAGGEAHALTLPLVTTASGTKFGKTAAGAVWLDPAETTPYRFWQFWINTDDRDASKYLRYFTLLPRETIEPLDRATSEQPERREAQLALANEVTTRVHGAEAARVAAEVSGVLFGGTDPATLSLEALEALRGEMPFTDLEAAGAPALSRDDSRGVDVLELFVAARLVPSKGAARRLLEQGGLYVNGRRLAATDRHVGDDGLLPGRHLLLRKGAKDYALIRLRER
jgi:tyrosyl-tRNA synthetase